MREIIFKAKRKDNGEWVEGLLIRMWGILHIQDSEDENTVYEIGADTLCQYTGLTDKNGKKIWENDVVRTNQYGVDSGDGRNFSGFDAFSINFSDGSFCLMNKWRRFNLRPSTHLKIIGNIFDGGFNDSKKTKEN